MSGNTVLSSGGKYTNLHLRGNVKMSKICDNINQTDLMRFWVSELTALSPKQVDSVLEVLKTRNARSSEQLAA